MANERDKNRDDIPGAFTGSGDNCMICSDIQNLAGLEGLSDNENTDAKHWFVMRDLKRPNAKEPAYKQLDRLKIEVFTPLKWCLVIKKGKRVREEVPFIHDLLFVHDTQSHLDPIVEKTPTLQYRYQKGKGYRIPMTVPDGDMEKFIHAVESTDNPSYYLPGELTPAMYGHKIRIVGGNLDGYEGVLLTTRGSKTKRILVELPTWIIAAIEVKLEYIQLL